MKRSATVIAVIGALIFAAKAESAPRKTLPIPMPIDQIMANARAPGATMTLINVWATWCDPCRDEMPDILRFYKKNRSRGLRLILISADAAADRSKAARFLARFGFAEPSFLKTGDDQAFIDGLDKDWGGTLPVSLMLDATGTRRHIWSGPVKQAALQTKLDELLAFPSSKKANTP